MQTTTMANATKERPAWSLEKETILIEFYQDHRSLWEAKHAEYLNRAKREAVLSSLVQVLGISTINGVAFTVKDVKRKFKNLRTTFGREIKKVEYSKMSGCGMEKVYKSRWVHKERLAFLKESMKPGLSTGSPQSKLMGPAGELRSDIVMMQEDESSGYYKTCKMEQDEGHADLSDINQPDECSEIETHEEASQVCEPVKLLSRKRKSQSSSRQSTMEEAYLILSAHEQKPAEDGEELFAKHVAFSLRSLSSFAREHAKLEIQQVLLKYCTNKS